MADNHQKQRQLKRREHPDDGNRQQPESPAKKARVEHHPAAALRQRRVLSVRANWVAEKDREKYRGMLKVLERSNDAGVLDHDEDHPPSPSSSPSTASTASTVDDIMQVGANVEENAVVVAASPEPPKAALVATVQREWCTLCVNLTNLVNRIAATGRRPIFYHNEVTGKELNSTALWALVDSGVAQTEYWHFCFATSVYYLCITLRKVLQLALLAIRVVDNNIGMRTEDAMEENVMEAITLVKADPNPLGLAGKISAVSAIIRWAGPQLARWIKHGRVREEIDFSFVINKLQRYQALTLRARVKMDEYDGTH